MIKFKRLFIENINPDTLRKSFVVKVYRQLFEYCLENGGQNHKREEYFG